jgi:hypothetical protein
MNNPSTLERIWLPQFNADTGPPGSSSATLF